MDMGDPPPKISPAEFSLPPASGPQRKAAAAGLDGLLVCSRGGGTVDRYANVFYLANFYSSFPFVPDRKPDWAARAHSFLLLPSAGRPLLVTDMPVRAGEVPVEDVLTADDVMPGSRRASRRGSMTRAPHRPRRSGRHSPQHIPGPAAGLAGRLASSVPMQFSTNCGW